MKPSSVPSPNSEPLSQRSRDACRDMRPHGHGERRLVVRDDVLLFLSLAEEQLQGLINTRQILPIRIAGDERFDIRDLERLVETYKLTAARRAQ